MSRNILFFLVVILFVVGGLYLFLQNPEKRAADERAVMLYYYNPALDRDAEGNILCSRQGLVPVERMILESATQIEDTIKLFLKGALTELERGEGITTEFPLSGLSLRSAELENGILTLVFDDPENRTGGGSCRVGILWFQIEATAKQFPGVEEVRFMPEELFQP